MLFSRGPLLAGVGIMVVCGGCGPLVRHGVVLRGHWQLELNRTPWDGGPEAVTACVPTVDSTATAEHAGEAGIEDVGALPLLGRPLLGIGTRLLRPAATATPVETYEHPRLHPVPTRPAFRYRAELDPPLWDEPPLPLPAPAMPPLRSPDRAADEKGTPNDRRTEAAGRLPGAESPPLPPLAPLPDELTWSAAGVATAVAPPPSWLFGQPPSEPRAPSPPPVRPTATTSHTTATIRR